jgi:CRP/FNR family transcriptional regulator, anaerobic regulatory protein
MEFLQLQLLLPGLETDLIREIASTAPLIELETDKVLLDIGSHVHSVPLVITGTVKVSRRDGDKELLLYNVCAGEICIMSFSACCNQTTSQIVASTTEPTSLLLLGNDHLRKWLRNFPSLNVFAFSQFNNRYIDLMDTIDQLFFYRLDERLIFYLQEKSEKSKNSEISITHQQIANDLGTAREVVSRIMKKLEKDGIIEQGRNQVRVLFKK